jgi:hypothetical protein
MGLYDEVEIEDMEWNEELEAFTYSCPCGDLFQISLVCTHWKCMTVLWLDAYPFPSITYYLCSVSCFLHV